VDEALGPAGLQPELWGDSHTRRRLPREDGEEYEEDAASEAVLKPAQDATPRPPQNPT